MCRQLLIEVIGAHHQDSQYTNYDELMLSMTRITYNPLRWAQTMAGADMIIDTQKTLPVYTKLPPITINPTCSRMIKIV